MRNHPFYVILLVVMKMKTIVFDFDGTLTKKSYEIWTKMWEAIDALDVDYKLYKQYKNKEIDYNPHPKHQWLPTFLSISHKTF